MGNGFRYSLGKRSPKVGANAQGGFPKRGLIHREWTTEQPPVVGRQPQWRRASHRHSRWRRVLLEPLVDLAADAPFRSASLSHSGADTAPAKRHLGRL